MIFFELIPIWSAYVAHIGIQDMKWHQTAWTQGCKNLSADATHTNYLCYFRTVNAGCPSGAPAKAPQAPTWIIQEVLAYAGLPHHQHTTQVS